jgi:recombination protein RecT
MSNTQLRRIAGASDDDRDPATFPGMLKKYGSEIARALPRHVNPDRMARIALTCFRQTPALNNCTPESIFAAVIQASQLGLEPGLQGRAYLIPYGRECQFVPGWKGLVELVNRTGRASAWTGAVFKGDDFDYALGDSPYVKHRPGMEDDPALLEYAYAIGRVKGAEWANIEVWPNGKIAKHRDRYNKVGKRHYSFDNWEMYARKVPLLQVLKYLPSSPELEIALTLNDHAEMGHAQGLTLDGVLAGTAGSDTPPPVNAEPPNPGGPPQHPPEPLEDDSRPSKGAPQRPGRVDKQTGEIAGGERDLAPTYPEVSEKIKAAVSAANADELAHAESLIGSVKDIAHQAMLRREVLDAKQALR